MTASPSRYLTFRAAGRLQALPADAVREVVKLPRITRVPHAPSGVVGIANVRGTALPILSVSALQGKASADGERVLVLDRADPIGLLVEDVHAIAETKGRSRALDIEALIGLAFRQVPARVGSAKARSVASPRRATEGATLDLVSFVAGGQEFALPLEQVREVIVMPTGIVRALDADRAVIGTVEHRGELLPIMALGALLGFDDRTSAPSSRVVIAMLRGHRIGLAVDAMRSLLRVEEDNVDPVPTVIARRASEARIQAIARLDAGKRLVSVLAADKLFDEALMAHIVERADNRAESEADMATEATEPFLIFRLGSQSFGLPAAAVQEITRLPETLTRLPRAPAFVEGVMNLRGRAIPVIDQRRRFGEETPVGRRRRAIVIQMGSLQAAFVVDDVAEIRHFPVAMLAPVPDISGETRLFDRTATMADGSIVLLIEPAELLDGTERDLLTALQTDTTSA